MTSLDWADLVFFSHEANTKFLWHHHEDGKTMILVDEDIHREFRHIGGQSTVNGKNKKGE
ncbi:HNH endonuclease [Paenibacillus sp. PK1-4R]|uniref:HNH endonuclease n=1 Tax=Paenibacillus sp. PK1-4R TaxID=3049075 RepID=UPI00338E257C